MDDTLDTLVIGGGVAGLSTAYHLSRKNRRVLLLDAAPDLGGLLGSYRLGETSIEAFYHHLQRNDHATIELIDTLQLTERLAWLPSSVGHFDGRTIHPMNTPIDIARFPHLTLGDKFRLARAVRLIKRCTDLKQLDDVSAREWLERHCGQRVYRHFFAPLLLGKFGDAVDDISASWLFGRIQFRGHRSWHGETLGYLQGGFQQLIDRLCNTVRKRCSVQCDTPVESAVRLADGRYRVRSRDTQWHARTVITTVPPSLLRRLIDLPEPERQHLEHLQFQKTLCALIALRRSLIPVYWCNIADPHAGFALLLEHTNFVSDPNYPPALIYVANYCNSQTDPLWGLDDSAILQHYRTQLQRTFGLRSSDVLWQRVARAAYSGLIYRRGFLTHRPSIASALPGLYTIGQMRSFPDRSINDALTQGAEAAQQADNYLANRLRSTGR